MSGQNSSLSNGLRVVSHQMPYLETVSLGVWIGSGSRHEHCDTQGIAHFLEHMAFKGTKSRTAYDIVEQIESVGGDLNAATGLDQTAYHALVLKQNVGLGLELLSDILLNPQFDGTELEREQQVILQEILAASESPDDVVFDLAQELAFPDQAIGRSVMGRPESVQSITALDLTQFMDEHYVASNMVIAAAGAIDHDELCALCERYFAQLKSGEAIAVKPANYKGGLALAPKPFDQGHVLVGFEGVSLHDDDLFTAQILSHILGGGMSSRLFQEIRERRGLAYNIYSFHSAYEDTGLFGIYGATDAEATFEMTEIMMKEFASIAEKGVASSELKRAKAQLRAGLAVSLESSASRAEQIARQMLFFDRVIENDELLAKLDRVDEECCQKLAGYVINGAQPVIALAGGEQSVQNFDVFAASDQGFMKQGAL